VRAGRVRARDLAQAALDRLAADQHVAVTRLLARARWTRPTGSMPCLPPGRIRAFWRACPMA
jgi:hypothetical protein